MFPRPKTMLAASPLACCEADTRKPLHTRIGDELYRLHKSAEPCIRPREAASELLAGQIAGDLRANYRKELATQRESAAGNT